MNNENHRPGLTYGPRVGNFLAIVLALCLCLGSALPVHAASAPAAAHAQTATAFDQLNAEAQAMALGINRARAAAGLPPLAVHPLLNQAAQAHVWDMIANNRYSHTGSDGSDVGTRVARTGYVVNGWAGENWVAMGGVQEGLSWWLNSAPHRANIYNPNWTEIGIGTGPHPEGWGTIFVTVFSRGSANQAPGLVPVDSTPPARTAQPLPAGGGSYTIQPGDTLSGVAIQYGISWQELAEVNGLTEWSVLSVGQTIRLPGGGEASPADSVAQNSGTGEMSRIQYTVQPGDTLLGIALNYDLTWQDVAAANGMSGSELLQVGQVLWVPVAGVAQEISTATTYTIQAGDTIISVAVRYSLDWQHLLDINGFNENTLLQIGQVIRLN